MRFLFISVLTAFLLLGGATVQAGAAVPDELIRIAIFKNSPEVVIDGDDLRVTLENGRAAFLAAPVRMTRSKDAVIVDGVAYRRLVFSSPKAVFVNGKPYRGTAEVIPADKGLLVVNELSVELYLVGLINCEISSAWPIEAVKAQAVIARTYALHRKETRSKALFHMESTVIDQVYEGCLIEDSRAARAVTETAGEVLTHNGSIAQAYYHSLCGGKTEAAGNVWGASLPYLKGVECTYCLTNPSTTWEQRMSLRELEEKLKAAGISVSGLKDIKPGAVNNRGRLKHIVIVSSRGAQTVTGDQFRKAAGYGIIKSTRMQIRVSNGEVFFNGSGSGHGVGLCQWGAKQRALDGFSYTEILSYYYPATELKMLFDIR
jgi:stage II sporulation protein D